MELQQLCHLQQRQQVFGATIGSKDKIGIVLFISIGFTCDKYKNFLNFAEQ